MKNIMLTVAYDGSGYHGFAFQENVETVEGEIKKAVDLLTGVDTEIIGASRTDAGVHAYGNVVVFATESTIPPGRFAPAINNKLPEDIRIMKSEEVPLDFHPRKCLSEKTYEYHILNVKTMIPTKRKYACYNSYPLDEKRMDEAAKLLIGEYDFTSFCAAGSQAISHTRRIIGAGVIRQGDEIIISVTGNGFLYNMVRIIAGTLMEIGRGKGEASDILRIIEAKNRSAAGPTAPPQGLYLMRYRFFKEEKEL